MPLPPPAVNAATFAHHAPNADPNAGDEVSQLIVAAGKSLEAAHRAITDAHSAHMANPMQTPAANLKRSADYASKTVQALANKMENYSKGIAAEVDALERKVNAPLALPHEPGPHYSATAQQIRAYFGNLPDDKRLDRAMKAAREGDTVTLGALLNAPGYLSGMDHLDKTGKLSQQEILREAYRQFHFGPELTRLEKLRKCQKLIENGTNTVLVHSVDLHPHKEMAQAAALDKAASDASARAAQFV
jgi:hypothetical protein